MTNPRRHSGISFVADIGGTNLRIARFQPGEEASAKPESLACSDFADITAALTDGFDKLGVAPRRGAIAIACPVMGDRVAMTNHPWSFSIHQLAQDLGLEDLKVVNDLEALAHALPHLELAMLEQIGGDTVDSTAPAAARAVIAPGTGLGVSGLLGSDSKSAAIAGEGGHVDFAPANEREVEIWRWFATRHDHVSVERILSGPGLVDLYRALVDVDDVEPAADPAPIDPAEIADLARSGRCPVAVATAREFSATLGAASGDLALTLGARGGVYLGGGVLAGLGDGFDRTAFRQRFEAKGRFRDYLRPIPCFLIGAAHPTLTGLAQLLAR